MNRFILFITLALFPISVLAATSEELASQHKAKLMGVWTRPRTEHEMNQPEPVKNSISADVKLYRHLSRSIENNSLRQDEAEKMILKNTISTAQNRENELYLNDRADMLSDDLFVTQIAGFVLFVVAIIL